MSVEELSARFASGAATVATCWSLTRRDGVVLGFTDHDDDLSFDGMTFAAGTGLLAHAVDRSTGGSVDSGQVAGALSAAAITEADILAGRYRGALVTQWLVDWQDVAVRIVQFRARIGEVRQGDGGFEAELLSLTDAYNRPGGRSYLRTCECRLGDVKCGVDLGDAVYGASGSVSEVIDRRGVRWVDGAGLAEGWFSGGLLTWTSGANAGETVTVEADSGQGMRLLRLRLEAAFPVAAGDTFDLLAGCDKTAATCSAKFGNLVNFRGFPHIPGSDWVTVYPRDGKVPKLPFEVKLG